MSETEVAKKPADAASSTAEPAAEKKSPTKKEADKLGEAMQHLASGKRHMLVKDISAACEAFSQSVQCMNELYGDTAAECAEAYFSYGRALLELARMERGVIENMDEADESADNSTDDDGDDAEVEGEKKEGEEENAKEEGGNEEAKAKEDKKEVNGEASKEEKEEEEGGEDDKADGNESIGSNEAAGTSSAEKEAGDQAEMEQEEEEDPSNLQLAWEILELAKICFEKKSSAVGDDDHKERLSMELKLAEIYQTLGELSIENETYTQAIEDLGNCLRRRQELLSEDDRAIAETHYQLGVAYGFNLEFDLAVEALNDAIIVLKKRVENLRGGKIKKDESDPFYSCEKEAEEIEGLIPEIQEKIADTKDMQRETLKKLGDRALTEETEVAASSAALSSSSTAAADASSSGGDGDVAKGKGASTKGSSSATNGHSAKPVNDISHMLKKRKSDTSNKVANGSNGAAAANGDSSVDSPAKRAKLEEK